jgi:ABC-type sugar transport system substrate-binding protein
MKRKRSALALTAALMTTLVTACGGGAETGAKASAGDSYSIGVVRFASSDPGSEGIVQSYLAAAKERGWETSSVDPQGAAGQAVGAISNFVQKQVDLIVVAVFPSDALAAGIKAAKAAGIPVVSIGGGTTDGVPVSLDFGRSNAKPLTEQMVKDTGGKGDLLVLGFTPGLPCVGREEELKAQLKETDIKVTRKEVPIPGQVEAGTEFAQAWLASHPKGSRPLAIWGCFDDPAIGAVSALRQTGRDDVLVYGINGTPAAVKAVKGGDMRATAYVDPATEGKRLADVTPDVIAAGTDAKERTLLPDVHAVTPANVDDFLKKFPGVLR